MRRFPTYLALFVVLLHLFFGAPCRAHEEQTPVIVDTDMALDDIRAIALMLGSRHVQVKAIVTSDGASSPEKGRENLRSVLEFLQRDEIPTGAGRLLPDAAPPPWRDVSEAMGWSDLHGQTGSDHPDAVSIISKVVSENEQGMSYICLGPMTNLADVLKQDPAARDRIKSVFCYGTLPDDPNPDWNTARDMDAARVVFSSGIPVYALRPADEDLLEFDAAMTAEVQKLGAPAAKLIALLHRDERVRRLLAEGHMKAWDESVALYLDNPEIGSMENAGEKAGKHSVYRLCSWDKGAARAEYLETLARFGVGQIEERMPVVLESYPLQPSRFQEDLRPWVPKIVALHGVEEWKATVLTNELHRHLGIYSIIGAKMGIRAREILGASLDELKVESRAGLKPPFSCLNDGLQVATGASLGRGTITVSAGEAGSPAVEAVFVKGDERLRLRLKDSVKARVGTDIRSAVERYGDLTPEYFKEVRRLSFQYWADMKREEIFEQQFETP